jgi:multidrug efflux pump subunit AcrB
METPAHNIYGRIARLFVENKELSLLLVISSFVFGGIAFYATPKQYDPQITLPAFRITANLTGASPEEVEKLVTNPIEEKLTEIPTVDEITLQSLPGGTSVVNVLFVIGSSSDGSGTEVAEKIHAVQRSLPPGTADPHIERIDPETVPVLTLALTSASYSADGLRDLALDMKDQLKTTPGVSAVEVYGGRTRELNIFPNAQKMNYRGVGMNDIITGLSMNNITSPVGSIMGYGNNIPTELRGGIYSARDAAHIRVGGSNAYPIYLEDVAKVQDGFSTTEHAVTLVHKTASGEREKNDAIYISVAKVQGTNISDVTRAVTERLAEIKRISVPKEVTMEVTRDEGETAHEEIMTLTEHLALAIIIVTVTLMFFLGLRVALVVATAIPLTLALVFIASYAFGSTINRITLFALIFSLGLLVDDAIVVIENIHRHLAMKRENKRDAIVTATGEVGSGVFLSTITAVVVFAPMGIVTGMMGAYMGPIAFFAPVARLASLVVAYTLSPYLSSVYFHKETAHEHKDHTPRYITWYRTLIAKILGDQWLQKKIIWSVTIFSIIVFTFPFVGIVHFRMLPKANKQQFYVYVDLNDQAPIESTHKKVDEIERSLLTVPEVTSIESFTGAAPVPDFNGLFRGTDARTQPSQATLKVNLTPKGERSRTSETIVVSARSLLAPLQDAGTRIKLVEDPPGPPVLATMLVRVKGPDTETREAITRDMVAQMQQIRGITDIESSLTTATHEVCLTVDRNSLARTGISVAEVMQTLAATLTGEAVGISHTDSREATLIRIHTEKSERRTLAAVRSLQLRARDGSLIPLRSIVKNAPGEVPTLIMHDAQERTTMIGAETEGRSVVYTTIDLMKFLYHYTLPDGSGVRTHMNLFGFTYEDTIRHESYTVEWGGEFEMTLKNFRDLGAAMILSYLLIYGILVAQFKSFRSAGLIMTTILLAFAGVIPGFAILDFFFGMYFSATSMIGAIALGGIVVGNAILLLDFIEQSIARGIPRTDAIITACETRVQPILLTAITAILGAAVIVADPVWSGLAWALMFGLSFSTVLTLVIFPILYFRSSVGRTSQDDGGVVE